MEQLGPGAQVTVTTIIVAGLSIVLGTAIPALAEGISVRKAMEGMARQPDIAREIRTTLLIAMALLESTAIYVLLVVLVEELNERVWEMGRGEMRQVEMLRRSLGERRPTVHVTAARPLSKEQQRDLVQTFGALADRTVSVKLEIDSALAAGVRVRLGDMIVENSVAQQLEDLRDEIGEALRERLAVDGDSPDEEADE